MKSCIASTPRSLASDVVVGVARLDDRLVHVDRAVAAFLVVAEAVVAELEVARIGDRLLRRALAERQRRHRHERLVGRARRIGAAQRPVEQRLVERLVQRLPVLDVDAVDEQVRVEVRLADEGEDLAVARIDRHQRAAPVAEQLLDHRLQPDVDRQHQRVAGRRRAGAQAPHRVAAGAHLHLLEAGGAVQLGSRSSARRRACRCIRCRGSWRAAPRASRPPSPSSRPD